MFHTSRSRWGPAELRKRLASPAPAGRAGLGRARQPTL